MIRTKSMTHIEIIQGIMKYGRCGAPGEYCSTSKCPIFSCSHLDSTQLKDVAKQWLKDHPEETEAETVPIIDNGKDHTEGQKHDNGKLDYTLLPFDSLKEVVKVLEFGKKKYERDNWQKVEPKERYLQAAFRHVVAYAQGEKLDEESGLSHLAHAVCCLLFLIWKEKES